MKKSLKILGIGAAILLITWMGVFPLQRIDGSINGKVVDPQGNALPGVTITVTGPALQGQMIYVTNETGIFQFSALPPGKNYVL